MALAREGQAYAERLVARLSLIKGHRSMGAPMRARAVRVYHAPMLSSIREPHERAAPRLNDVRRKD